MERQHTAGPDLLGIVNIHACASLAKGLKAPLTLANGRTNCTPAVMVRALSGRLKPESRNEKGHPKRWPESFFIWLPGTGSNRRPSD